MGTEDKHNASGQKPPRPAFPAVRLALALAVAALAPSARGEDYIWLVIGAIDGDTVRVDASADIAAPELARLSVRLRGVDAPERGGRAACEAERVAGEAATAFVEAALASARAVAVRDPEWDKWGGRVLADLIVDGRSLAAALIASGHGRAYAGGKRENRCEAP